MASCFKSKLAISHKTKYLIMDRILKSSFTLLMICFLICTTGCKKNPWGNISVTKKQESRLISRIKLQNLHPDSAIIAGKIYTWQAVCDADSILTINGRFVHVDVEMYIQHALIADTGTFRITVPVGEHDLVARHHSLPSLNAKLNVIVSSQDSIYVEMKIGSLTFF